MRARVLTVVAVALLAGPAAGAAAQKPWTVSANALGKTGDQHIDYPDYASRERAAPSLLVAGVGDVNGDGLEDVGAGFDGYPYEEDRIYVTWSDRLGGVGQALGLGGFQIRAPRLWFGLAGAGDVNGDGLGDVAWSALDAVTVVFGRREPGTVDAAPDALGADGFRITGAGRSVGSGFGQISQNAGVVPLGDVSGDGVPDLLLPRGGGARIVMPPRNAAGMTIDASQAGPYVTVLTPPEPIDDVVVDTLGDQNGDGRADVLVAGQRADDQGQVAYGVLTPALPGRTIDLGEAVARSEAFEVRTADGAGEAFGGLEDALTLTDQNGDGRRDVGLVGYEDRRVLRVVHSPEPGTRLDVDDLRADARGYRFNAYSGVLDLGDQDGDGVGDFSTSNYVYFPDPKTETGDREAVYSGFYFDFADRGQEVVGSLADLNGDKKRELIVAKAAVTRRSGAEVWEGEDASYALDVYDSADPPVIEVPQLPQLLPNGLLEVPVDLLTGAGSRGAATLGLNPRLELAAAGGAPVVANDGGITTGNGRRTRLALTASPATGLGGAPLQPGTSYRARYAVGNGRGLTATGPWRSFVFSPTAGLQPAAPPRGTAPATKVTVRRGTRRADRLRGTNGRDRLVGLAGDDVLDGRGGDDALDGGPGRDRLLGGAGDDVAAGGSGKDRIVGGKGKDLLDGGPGDDVLDARDGVRDIVRCGKGRDSVRADRKDRLSSCERKRR